MMTMMIIRIIITTTMMMIIRGNEVGSSDATSSQTKPLKKGFSLTGGQWWPVPCGANTLSDVSMVGLLRMRYFEWVESRKGIYYKLLWCSAYHQKPRWHLLLWWIQNNPWVRWSDRTQNECCRWLLDTEYLPLLGFVLLHQWTVNSVVAI